MPFELSPGRPRPLRPIVRAARLGLARLILSAAALAPVVAGAQDEPQTGSADATQAVPQAAPRMAQMPRQVPRAFGDYPTVRQLTDLGRRVFMDPGLSASGKMACATCHSPRHAFGPPNARAVQLGGPDLKRAGTRSVPSLRYLQTTIPFTEHFIDDDDNHGEDAGPTGGLTWDGRVNTPREQALLPLSAAHEMAAGNARAITARLRKAPYAGEFRHAFSAPGKDVFNDPEEALGWLVYALEVYQQNPAEFYPFTSKYDAFLRRQTDLSPRELRGLTLFNDPGKGNCASCHQSGLSNGGGFPLFSDSGFAVLGVPRNRRIPANADPRHYDLGLCGPERSDLRAQADYCGMFKAPTLRNVATRKTFFHNGVFSSLEQVMRFYVERDLRPEKWYPRGTNGRVLQYDDLPAQYRENVNREAPFDGAPDGGPRLSQAEIGDVIAFLKTLTDGFQPKMRPEAAAKARQVTPAP